jgi:hypothetical protein
MVGHKLGEFAPTRTFTGHHGNNLGDQAAAAGAAAPLLPAAAPLRSKEQFMAEAKKKTVKATPEKAPKAR